MVSCRLLMRTSVSHDGSLSYRIGLFLSEKLSFTTTFLLNFTDLHTGRGTDAHVMPGLTFGLRF